MKTIEIITHCWQYSRVLVYQLSSLELHYPPNARVKITVRYSADDPPTCKLIDYFEARWQREHLLWLCRQEMDTPRLLRRAIGRNEAAFRSTGDIVWFTDADYVFGEHCLETLAQTELVGDRLFYPYFVWINKWEFADRCALEADELRLYDIDPNHFEPSAHGAIGGLQIVPGSIARTSGYCPDLKKWQEPVANGLWQDTREDKAYRKSLGTKGTAIYLPNLYRIRQNKTTVVDTLVQPNRVSQGSGSQP